MKPEIANLWFAKRLSAKHTRSFSFFMLLTPSGLCLNAFAIFLPFLSEGYEEPKQG
jgi:hypothetical protein